MVRNVPSSAFERGTGGEESAHERLAAGDGVAVREGELGRHLAGLAVRRDERDLAGRAPLVSTSLNSAKSKSTVLT